MLFNSFVFLYLFLPITYVVFWRLKDRASRYAWMTAASYVFYGYWNWKFCFWMALSTGISYACGLALLSTNDDRRRRVYVGLAIATDLTILGVFKYTNFAISTVNAFRPGHSAIPMLDIVLPIGISFYTFHTISYVVDCYRGVVRPTRNFLEFACYVSLFSQLVAGPIVRFRQVEADLENLDKADRRERLSVGWSFFVIGLAKKVIIADTIASVIDPALASPERLSTASVWLCVLGYTYQLYFDFSGYSDMAVGLGHMFGIRLPQNFNSPYKATSPADFWRRWHISLSTCLRDYLYIPLGGNRGGSAFVVRNLLLTMLIGGLWHGANWTFVVWGAYHGLLLVLYRLAAPVWDRSPRWLQCGATFFLVMIGWVFFRAPDLSTAIGLLGRMFAPTAGVLVPGAVGGLIGVAIAAAVAHLGRNTFEMKHEWTPRVTYGWAAVFAVCLFVMYGGHASPFLYFQF